MARILVVEDEPELREIIVLELNDVGHQTSEAGNGQEALSAALEYKPELILSDITMPVMNGYQFFRTLREKHPELSQTPFIFLSALADKNDVLKGYRLGADDYIPKPIDFELLVARIDARLKLAAARGAVSAEDIDADIEQEVQTTAEGSHSNDQSQDALMAAKLQTVSLDQIRRRCGDQWEEVREKILRNAEQVIRSHLHSDDVFEQLASGDFIITFANRNEEVAARKIQTIKDALWERLYGAVNDDVLSEVHSELHELEISKEEDKGEGFLGRIYEKIKEAGKRMTDNAEEKIEKIFRQEKIIISDILSVSDQKRNLTRVDFSDEVNKKIDHIIGHNQFDKKIFSKLNQIFLEKFISQIPNINKSVIVVPLRLLMVKSDNRINVETLLNSIDEKIQERVIIERIQLSNRLSLVEEEMRPFTFGRRIQMVELRMASQVINFDLRKNRTGIVSMKYEDVVDHYAKGMSDIIGEFRRHGGRFYIKGVPEKKLADARRHKPDLIGLRT